MFGGPDVVSRWRFADELFLVRVVRELSISARLVRFWGERRLEMQYLLLIYEKEERFAKGFDPKELGEYQAFGKEFEKQIKGGNALQPTSAATTVRLRDGKRLTTDGPFAETKEQLGGYYVVEAGDLDEAIDMAGKIPGARFGSVEVRPVMKFS
jgi:hypothetical protein